MRPNWIAWGVASFFVVVTAAALEVSKGRDEPTPSSRTRVQRFYLKAGDGEYFSQVLVARRYDEQEMLQRFLVVSPERNRLVVTSRIGFAQGVFEYELLHEGTGWWARLEIDPGLRDLPPFGQPGAVSAFGRRLIEEDPLMSFSFSTADGFWWRRQGLASEEGEPFSDLGAALAGASSAGRIPPGALEGAAFFTPLVTRRTIPETDHYLGAFLELMTVAASVEGGQVTAYRELSWEVGPGEARLDSPEIDDGELELIRQFPSLADEGLFGRRPSEAEGTAEEMEP